MSGLNFVDAPTDVVVQHSGDSVILTSENWEKVKERIRELEGFLKKLGYCTCHGVWNCPDEQEKGDE